MPLAQGDRGRLILLLLLLIQQPSSSLVWKQGLVLSVRLQTPHHGEAASETRGIQRHLCDCSGAALSQSTLNRREDTWRQQREDISNVADTSLYICVTIFRLLWEYWRKCLPLCKSRCEEYHLFAAYNFLLQAVLNSFVCREGINKTLFSIHML